MTVCEKKKVSALIFLSVLVLLSVLARHATELRERPSGILDKAKDEFLNEGPYKLININEAKPSELELIPGIGEVYAARIVGERSRRNGFTSIDELKSVKGIGDKRMDTIRKFAGIWKSGKK